ncbi:hypothetical protein J4480_06055 [Candidatus Woesearchaeota archaeon]|nr:hypothetical protein [Candidatus Woesearchaeota archaeon]
MPLERDVAGNNLYIVEHCKVALTNYWTINPAPADFLEQQFEKRNLNFVSPSQLGFLRAKDFSPDLSETRGSSITNTDIFYEGGDRIILVPDGAITKLTGLVNLVKAHKQRKEYVIPENQRRAVYSLVDELLRKGTAFSAHHGTASVETSEFELNGLTSKLFSDERLGIKAEEYGRWLKRIGINKLTVNFGDRNYAISQEGPFVNRVHDLGNPWDFELRGYGIIPSYKAYGVRFEKTAEVAEK